MKATRVDAWECSQCGTLFGNDYSAEQCCDDAPTRELRRATMRKQVADLTWAVKHLREVRASACLSAKAKTETALELARLEDALKEACRVANE